MSEQRVSQTPRCTGSRDGKTVLKGSVAPVCCHLAQDYQSQGFAKAQPCQYIKKGSSCFEYEILGIKSDLNKLRDNWLHFSYSPNPSREQKYVWVLQTMFICLIFCMYARNIVGRTKVVHSSFSFDFDVATLPKWSLCPRRSFPFRIRKIIFGLIFLLLPSPLPYLFSLLHLSRKNGGKLWSPQTSDISGIV